MRAISGMSGFFLTLGFSGSFATSFPAGIFLWKTPVCSARALLGGSCVLATPCPEGSYPRCTGGIFRARCECAGEGYAIFPGVVLEISPDREQFLMDLKSFVAQEVESKLHATLIPQWLQMYLNAIHNQDPEGMDESARNLEILFLSLPPSDKQKVNRFLQSHGFPALP